MMPVRYRRPSPLCLRGGHLSKPPSRDCPDRWATFPLGSRACMERYLTLLSFWHHTNRILSHTFHVSTFCSHASSLNEPRSSRRLDCGEGQTRGPACSHWNSYGSFRLQVGRPWRAEGASGKSSHSIKHPTPHPLTNGRLFPWGAGRAWNAT
jgi:hypothetical protein